MRRFILSTLALSLLFAGLSFGQGPLTNALNLQVRTDSNGSLYVYGVAAGAQGPLTNLGNLRLRAYSPGALAVTLVGGAATPDSLCLDAANQDACLFRDAADTLGQRRGTNAQRFNVYNTYTSATVNEFASIYWDTNVAYFVAGKGSGGGTARTVTFGVSDPAQIQSLVFQGGTDPGNISFKTGGAERWQIAGLGHLVAASDNAYDIGASGATRPRDVFIADDLIVGDDAFFAGISAGAAGDTDACLNSTTNELTDAGASTCIVSSVRYKENIEPLSSGLRELLRLTPVSYTYKNDTKHIQRIGILAENMLEAEPRLVFYEQDGVTPRGVSYEESTALLVNAIKDLAARVAVLEAEAQR